MGALSLLCAQGHWDAAAKNVLLEVFDVDGDDEVASLFTEINSAEPVRLVDLPPQILEKVEAHEAGREEKVEAAKAPSSVAQRKPVGKGKEPVGKSEEAQEGVAMHKGEEVRGETITAKDQAVKGGKKGASALGILRREVLESVAQTLRERYPDLFRETARCRPPHLNIDLVREELFHCAYLSSMRPQKEAGKGKTRTPEEVKNEMAERLLARIGQVNEELKADLLREGTDQKKPKAHLLALTKAKEHNLFLGMRRDWAALL